MNMKKSIMLFCLFASVAVQAQVDTLQGKVPYFHYNYYDSNWCKSQVNQNAFYCVLPGNIIINELGTAKRNPYTNEQLARGFGMCYYNYETMASEVAIQMNMDSAMEIKGFAFGYNFVSPDSTLNVPLNYNTDDYIFNLYDDGMNKLWSDTIATSDMQIDYYMEAGFRPTRGAYDSAYYQWYSNNGEFHGYEAPAYIGLCYVMFDTTIQVPETFYVGITSSTPINILYDTSLVITTFVERYHITAINDSLWCMPYETRRYRVSQGSGEAINDWEDEECHYGVQTCLYPILDLPCDDISGLRCESVGSAGTIAFVQWDTNPRHAAYEVSYGPKGTPAGAGTVVTTTAPRFMLTLDRNTHYDFYVRARCDYDTTKWSAWSDTLHVHLATFDIQGAESVECSIMPNPAHGSVTVQCSEGIKKVELFTVKGDRVNVTHAPALGRSSQDFCPPSNLEGELRSCSLDLTGLAKGVYIVQITTAQGTAARKLAVE